MDGPHRAAPARGAGSHAGPFLCVAGAAAILAPRRQINQAFL